MYYKERKKENRLIMHAMVFEKSDCSIYLKCIFRTHFCRCSAKIYKIKKLLDISCIRKRDANANNDKKLS